MIALLLIIFAVFGLIFILAIAFAARDSAPQSQFKSEPSLFCEKPTEQPVFAEYTKFNGIQARRAAKLALN